MKSVVILTLGSAVMTACGNSHSLDWQMLYQTESTDIVSQTLPGSAKHIPLTKELEAFGVLNQAVNVPNNQTRTSCIPAKR